MKWCSICSILALGAQLLADDGEKSLQSPRFGAVIRPSMSSPSLSLAQGRLLTVEGENGDCCTKTHRGKRLDAILWDTETGRKIQEFKGHNRTIWAVTFSPDCKYVLTGAGLSTDRAGIPDLDNTARLWNTETGKEVRRFEGHRALVNSVRFSADGRRVFTVGRDSTARLWETATGQEICQFDRVIVAVLSPDGRYVVGPDASTHHATIWDAYTGKVVAVLQEQSALFREMVDFDPTSTRVLTASTDSTLPHGDSAKYLLGTWDVKTGRELRVFAGHTSYIQAARFLADGKRIISASMDGTVRLWDVNTGKEIRQFKHAGSVEQILLSGKNKTVYVRWRTTPVPKFAIESAMPRGTLWDIESGKEIAQRIDIVAFSPDGTKFLALESLQGLQAGRPVTWWDAETGKQIPRRQE